MSPRNQNNRKKTRKIGYLSTVQNRYYLFCEGKKTEPIYFQGFKDAITENPIYKNIVHIEVEGVGAETLRVLYAAEEYVKGNNITNAQIWCIYDKDCFPPQDFNAVSERVKHLNINDKNVRYYTAWSNQCIEYWFILHFDWYESDNDRYYYRQYLHEKFASLGWTRYEKNNKELFNILSCQGDPKLAIRHAKRRINCCKGCCDSDSAPATKVHLLVEELARYLPDELKQRYI